MKTAPAKDWKADPPAWHQECPQGTPSRTAGDRSVPTLLQKGCILLGVPSKGKCTQPGGAPKGYCFILEDANKWHAARRWGSTWGMAQKRKTGMSFRRSRYLRQSMAWPSAFTMSSLRHCTAFGASPGMSLKSCHTCTQASVSAGTPRAHNRLTRALYHLLGILQQAAESLQHARSGLHLSRSQALSACPLGGSWLC